SAIARFARLGCLAVGIAAMTFAASASFAGGRGHDGPGPHRRPLHQILEFHTMYGVDGPFVGDANPIDGIPGDELPWEIRAVNGHLYSNGRFVIIVRGLVFKDDPSVPED